MASLESPVNGNRLNKSTPTESDSKKRTHVNSFVLKNETESPSPSSPKLILSTSLSKDTPNESPSNPAPRKRFRRRITANYDEIPDVNSLPPWSPGDGSSSNPISSFTFSPNTQADQTASSSAVNNHSPSKPPPVKLKLKLNLGVSNQAKKDNCV